MAGNLQTSPNAHNDFMAALLETVEDCRGLIALAVAEEKLDEVRRGRMTRLPADHPDFRQVVRHLDAVVAINENKAADSKVSYEHTYLLEFKSEIRQQALLGQLLIYILILLRFCLLVTPIVVYTGKRSLNKTYKRIRAHAWLKTLIANKCGLSLTCIILNLADVNLSTLLRYAPTIAAGLYLAKHIYHLTAEHIAKFFQLCNAMPDDLLEKMVENGCVYIIKCAVGYGWDRLEGIECEVLPEGRRVVARVAYSREAAVAEGKAEGKAAGRGEERRDIAMKMIRKGKPDAEISELTGLSKKELALLKRGMKLDK